MFLLYICYFKCVILFPRNFQSEIFIFINMAISKERIREIAHLTIGQRDNPLWQQYRKNRFTASQFGKILNSYFSDEDRSWYSDFVILRKELLGNKPIPRSPPLVWGEKHEHLAIQEYEKKQEIKLSQLEFGFSQMHISEHPPMELSMIQKIQPPQLQSWKLNVHGVCEISK